MFELDRMPLVPGSYTLTVGVWDPETRTPLMVERAAEINVIAADIYNSGWAHWQSVVPPVQDQFIFRDPVGGVFRVRGPFVSAL